MRHYFKTLNPLIKKIKMLKEIAIVFVGAALAIVVVNYATKKMAK